MKTVKPILITFGLCMLAWSCSDDNNGKDDSPPSGEVIAKIDGQTFTPTENTVTDIGTGLEVKLKEDDDNYIVLRFSSKTPGTYQVMDVSASGRTQEEPVYVECVGEGEQYFGESGEAEFSINENALSFEFSFVAENGSGDKVDVSGGQGSGIPIQEPPAGVCRVTKVQDGSYFVLYGYDADGRLVTTYMEDGPEYRTEENLAYDANGKLIKIFSLTTDETDGETNISASEIVLSYNSEALINTLERNHSSGTSIEYTFEYNENGELIGVEEGDLGCNITSTLTYTGGNVVLVEEDGCVASTTTFSDFDNKKNPALLFLEAFGDQPAMVYWYVDHFGLNNAGTVLSTWDDGEEEIEEFTYEYNSSGYPTTMTETGDLNEVTTFTYQGCN